MPLTTITAEDVARACGYRGVSGRKEYSVKCPAHADKSPSLSIGAGTDGTILLFCHAGCRFEEVRSALEQRGVDIGRCARWEDKEYRVWFDLPKFGRICATFRDSPHYEVVEPYEYKWQNGDTYKINVRFSPKTFRQYHLGRGGRWVGGKGPGPHFPYLWWEQAVPGIAEGRVIHIPEGEKDVHTLLNWGLCATTTGGINSEFELDQIEQLAKAPVVVWADRDSKGQGLERAERLCAAVYNHGGKCKLVMPRKGKDVTDWQMVGATLADVEALLAETPLFQPTAVALQAAVADGSLPASDHDLATQAWAGDYFAHKHRDEYRVVSPIREWYWFNGKVWEPDAAESHRERVKALHKQLRKDMQLFPLHARERVDKLTSDVQSARGVSAVVRMAQTVGQLQQDISDFDSDETAHLFACQNGVYDMRKGVMYAHCPEFLLTSCSPYPADFSRQPARFIEFLRDLWPGQEEIAEYQEHFLGYCCTGVTSFQKFQMLVGEPGSGKSQLLLILKSLLGPYFAALDAGSLRQTHQRSPGVESDIASTRNARLVVAAELSAKYKLDEQLIKAITGEDPVKVKFMNQDKFDLKARAKLVFTANDRPPLSDDGGIARRLMEVKFPKKIEKPVQGFARKLLTAEGPQILGYLLTKATFCYATDFDVLEHVPPAIVEWTSDWIDEANTVAQWARERLAICRGWFVPSADLFSDWCTYCKDNCMPQELSSIDFGRKLSRLGYKLGLNKDRTKRGVHDVMLVSRTD